MNYSVTQIPIIKDLNFSSLLFLIKKFPDNRFGKNSQDSLEDLTLSAFAVFYFQEPSFLEFQKNMQNKQNANNATNLFGIKNIPSDNQM